MIIQVAVPFDFVRQQAGQNWLGLCSSTRAPVNSRISPLFFSEYNRLIPAMFIAIIGTASAGKSTVEEYLVAKEGFTPIRLSKGTNADVCIHSISLHSSARMN